MKAYQKVLAGAGLLASICGCVATHSILPVPEQEYRESFTKTRRFVESHMDRKDLSFLKVTYQFKELGGELIACYPKSEDQDPLLIIKKGGDRVLESEVMRDSLCAGCHNATYKRVPVKPDVVAESG
jgi:hypothetical protein